MAYSPGQCVKALIRNGWMGLIHRMDGSNVPINTQDVVDRRSSGESIGRTAVLPLGLNVSWGPETASIPVTGLTSRPTDG